MRDIFEKGREALRRGLKARAQGHAQEAIDAYGEALELFRRSNQTSACVVALNNIAAVMQTTGRCEDAANFYREALALSEEDEALPGQALSCGNLGALHLDQGDIVRAELLIERSLALYTSLSDASGRANQLGNLGLIASARGQLDTAREHMSAATGAFLAAGNLLGAGRTLLGLGEFARQEGDRDAAAGAFSRAVELLRQAGDKTGCANALRGLGQLALRAGQIDQASQLITEAMKLHRDMEDRRGEAAAMIDMSNLHQHRAEPRKALDFQLRAAEINNNAGFRDSFASSLLASGSTHLDLGEVTQSDTAIAAALTLFEALETPRGVANALATRARLMILRGEIDAAQRDLDRAMAIALSGGFLPLEAALKGLCAKVAALRGETASCRGLLAQAVELYGQADTPSGAHTGALALLELEVWAAAQPPARALEDERLKGARAFFEASKNREALFGLERLEASIKNACGDCTSAAAQLTSVAERCETIGRRPDALSARASAFEALLRTESAPAPEEVGALASEAMKLGMKLLALRCGLLEALAWVKAGDAESATERLVLWAEQLDEISGRYHHGHALLADVSARLSHAAGDTEAARSEAGLALGMYEAAENMLRAAQLRRDLQL